MKPLLQQSQKRPLVFVIAIALAWPPVYSLLIHPHLILVASSPHPTTRDLQRLLGARRYTLHVPAECDGWYLSLEAVVDGVAKRSGGSTVFADTEITLLVRRTRDTERIEYCWFSENQLGRGLLDDPIVEAGVTSRRAPGAVKSGDWLFRGGRKSLQYAPDAEADFEVRIALKPPRHDDDA